jgi:hypothetical protein
MALSLLRCTGYYNCLLTVQIQPFWHDVWVIFKKLFHRGVCDPLMQKMKSIVFLDDLV